VSTLSVAKNITILAPNNAAFANWMATKIGEEEAMMPDMVTALLQYHVLKGSVPSTSITTTPSFVETFLTNTTYTNVTGGQRVEAVKMGNMVMVYSGLKMNSTVVTAVRIFKHIENC
jgi:transforming growth factor-beta-induced protein